MTEKLRDERAESEKKPDKLDAILEAIVTLTKEIGELKKTLFEVKTESQKWFRAGRFQ